MHTLVANFAPSAADWVSHAEWGPCGHRRIYLSNSSHTQGL
jgi:hypothetical protein